MVDSVEKEKMKGVDSRSVNQFNDNGRSKQKKKRRGFSPAPPAVALVENGTVASVDDSSWDAWTLELGGRYLLFQMSNYRLGGDCMPCTH